MKLPWKFIREVRDKAKKDPGRPVKFRHKLLKFAAITLLISILVEIFICNFNSFLTWGGGYSQKSFDLSDTTITGMDEEVLYPGVFIASSVRPSIVLNVNEPIRTLYVDAYTEKDARNELVTELSYTDSGRSQISHSSKQLRIVKHVDRTQYTLCSYSDTTNTVILTFQVDNGEILHINDIQVNKPIPFHFSIFRVLLILIICCSMFIFLKAPSFSIPFCNASVQVISLITVLIITMLAVGGTYLLYTGTDNSLFTHTSGDQVTQELVDAFENGQVSLMDKPTDDLLTMNNPYDYTARLNQKVQFKWDHVLFNGKYYSYYGIAPVLLLFLPYHLLTGYYLPSHFACLLFSMIGTILLFCLYFVMMSNWFKNTPFRLMLCGLIIVLISDGIFFCICRPSFYEMEEAAGFMFSAAGIWELFRSGICTKKKIRLRYLCFSAVFMSLAVLSRPTFVLYAISMLLWLGCGLFQYHSEHSEKTEIVRYLAAALLPFIIIGSIQMTYNYLRFGSIFQFGIKYSLTINDFTHTRFYPEQAFISFWNLLFCIPIIKSTFPFFQGNLDYWGFNGYYFAENGDSFGLLWRALPLFSTLYIPKTLQHFDRRNKLKAILLCGVPGLIVPIYLVLCTWESGHALRYNIDFAWQMLLLSLAIIFFVYGKIHNLLLKNTLSALMIVCTVFCVIANTALLFQHVPNAGVAIFESKDAVTLYYRIARTFQFWF